jgi:hypothetical protein
MATATWVRKLFGTEASSKRLRDRRFGPQVEKLEDRLVPTITEHVTAGGFLQISPISSIFPSPGYTRMDVLATTVPGVKYGIMGRGPITSLIAWGSGPPNAFEPAALPSFNQNRVFAGDSFDYINANAGAGSSESIPIRFSDGFTTADDTLVIDIDAAPPPQIYTQPASLTTIQPGQTATLSVLVLGSGPLSYQWYNGTSGDTGNPINGATASSFTTPVLNAPGQYSYWVRVNGPTGTSNSSTAAVNVQAPTTTTTTASSTTATFNPAAQTVTLQATVTANNATLNAGTVTFTVPGVGITTSGVVANNLATAVLTIPAGTTAGVYAIQAHYQGSANVGDSSDNTQRLTIGKATPALTWTNPADITYSTPLGATQLNAAAGVAGSFVYTPAAGTVLSAGLNQTLATTFTPTDTTDYTSASLSVSLNVNQAPLTITADNITRPYGAANPTLTASYSGFVNHDTAASLTTPPMLSTTAAIASLPGIYPINVGGAVAANYTITYVPGTLTVQGLPTLQPGGPTGGQSTGATSGQPVQVGDGTAQRSEVTSVTLTFSSPVVAVPPGSIVIYAGTTALVPTGFVVSGNQVTVQFTGLPGLVNGSLPDGRYTVTVNGQVVSQFFRLFGDVNGDGKVDDTDRTAFLAAYRSRKGMSNYRAYLDVNGDGVIDSVDYFQFQMRFGTQLAP